MFLREYASKQYGAVAYFISKTMVEMPVILLGTLIQYAITYYIMELQGNFFYLVWFTWLLGLASSSLALVIGCGVASPQKAIQLAPLVLIPQMLFSGLFLPVQKIPQSLQWVKYLCPLKYAISLLCDIEFDYVKQHISDCESTYNVTHCQFQIPGDYARKKMVENESISWDYLPQDMATLLSLLVGFRIIATILLWRKGKYVY